MGFPVGCTEVLFPYLILYLLSLLGYIRSLISSLFDFLGLSDFIETDAVWPERQSRIPDSPSVSTLLIRELLPVIKFSDLTAVSGETESPESCAVCLYEFEESEEIRRLTNCIHIFHRDCLDRWMDHDRKTCPLCRTPLLADEMQREYNQRLWPSPENLTFTVNTARSETLN